MSVSEHIEMCKIVHLHGFQRPELRVHLAPEVHYIYNYFEVGCVDFQTHVECLKCFIKHRAAIVAR